ncbi:hypothetical protein POW79_19800 [Enterobacter quasiroggenkampii]|uniref:hypothetical protein n=1 Tax=Enterobacter quasiroggenkampii TaxID=2497436 RepID=UPI002FF9C29D
MEIIEKAENILKIFIEDIENNDSMRDHDKRFGAQTKRLKLEFKKLPPPFNVISERLYTISKNTFYLIELFDYKIYLLAKGVLNSIETSNPLTLANNTRAIIEQMAVYHYCIYSIGNMLESLKDQGVLVKISEIIEKCEKVLQRTYAGQGKSYAEDGAKAIHVNEAIKSLGTEITDALEVYDYLCEFVHPNYGSNLLVSSGDLGNGIITARKLEDKNIENMLNIICSVLEHLNLKKTINLNIIWQLEHYVELCMMRKVTLGGIFAVKKAIPIGDGKSIKDAYFFKNARTSQEGMQLMYQYLSEMGYNINPQDRQQVKDTESLNLGYHIDLWDTPLGKFYFKTKTYVGF